MPADRLVERGYSDRTDLVRCFFDVEAARLARLCHTMARRFIRGGRLLAFGAGAAATDAQHISVEFVHPVIVGKRALPAIALTNDVPSALGLAAREGDAVFSRLVELMGSPEDMAIGLVHGQGDPGRRSVAAGLDRAASLGLLAIGFSGPESVARDGFQVPSDDPFIVQEIHETAYHVLWELVHVFFDHKGLLEDRPTKRAHDSGGSSFLYPFLNEAESGMDEVLEHVESSIRQKAEDVITMRNASMDPVGLAETARLIGQRIAGGGKVLAFGNGGSATDAQDLVADLVSPPCGMPPVPALSLTNDAAVITAVGNDVGFENVFARQVISYGNEKDVAVAISTSGGSRNVLAAVEEAKRRGLLTVGFAGYGGGRLADVCDRCHGVAGDYIPRIQEAQATQYHLLCSLIFGSKGR